MQKMIIIQNINSNTDNKVKWRVLWRHAIITAQNLLIKLILKFWTSFKIMKKFLNIAKRNEIIKVRVFVKKKLKILFENS